MERVRFMNKNYNMKLRENQTKKRIANIEYGPSPDYPSDIDHGKYWRYCE